MSHSSASPSDIETRRRVADAYTVAVEKPAGSCCGPGSEYGGEPRATGAAVSAGYDPAETAGLPTDAVVNSFGCGNPLALAGIEPG